MRAQITLESDLRRSENPGSQLPGSRRLWDWLTGHGLDCERLVCAELACGSKVWGALSAPAGDKVKLPACLLGPRQLS